MNDAFLPADVCAKLVEAGMVVGQEQAMWWQFFDMQMSGARYSLKVCHGLRSHDLAAIDTGKMFPAVTPLQALDWLVASGRIAYYIIGSIEGIDCLASTADENGWFEYPVKWRGVTPTDLVRAILEAA
jgi:hypothetical protein